MYFARVVVVVVVVVVAVFVLVVVVAMVVVAVVLVLVGVRREDHSPSRTRSIARLRRLKGFQMLSTRFGRSTPPSPGVSDTPRGPASPGGLGPRPSGPLEIALEALLGLGRYVG